MNSYDVVILGAGASGLMCASEAASRGRKVLLLDHEEHPGRKILASGGGHCNFTNLHAGPDHYVTMNPDFLHSPFARFRAKDFLKRVPSVWDDTKFLAGWPGKYVVLARQGDGKWFIAFCPEVPGANGQGKTREECLESLAAAIELVLDYRREQSLENAPRGAEQTSVLV